MPAAEIFFLARVIRAAIVGSATRNARPISAVVSPPSSRSVSATLASAGSAGWQQVNSSRSRSSGMVDMSVTTSGSSGISSGSLRASVASRRNRSVAFRRAAVSSHASGLAGMPSRAQRRQRGLVRVLERLLGHVQVVADEPGEQGEQAPPVLGVRLLDRPPGRLSGASPGVRVLDGLPGRRVAGMAPVLGVRVLDGLPGRRRGAGPGVRVLDGLPGRPRGAAPVRLLDRCLRAHLPLRTSSLSLGSSGIFFPHATASSMLGTSIR